MDIFTKIECPSCGLVDFISRSVEYEILMSFEFVLIARGVCSEFVFLD